QEAERKELLAMFEGLNKDRAGFLSFIDEGSGLVAQTPGADLETQRRLIHTLKGSSALAGLAVVADLCHKLEEQIAEYNVPFPRSLLAPIERRWADLMESLRVFLGDRGRNVIELQETQLDALGEAVLSGLPARDVLDRLASWRLE